MTDLDRLHLVHESLIVGYTPRQCGKTFYHCHVVCGQLLLLENVTIAVVVANLDRIGHFSKTLMPILKEYDIEFDKWDSGSRRLLFKNNSNTVKYFSFDQWVKSDRYDPYNGYISHDQHLIFDPD